MKVVILGGNECMERQYKEMRRTRSVAAESKRLISRQHLQRHCGRFLRSMQQHLLDKETTLLTHREDTENV